MFSNGFGAGGFNRFHKIHNATGLEASSIMVDLCVVCQCVIWISHGFIGTRTIPSCCCAAMPMVDKYNYNVIGGSTTVCSLVNLVVPSGVERPPTLAPV